MWMLISLIFLPIIILHYDVRNRGRGCRFVNIFQKFFVLTL